MGGDLYNTVSRSARSFSKGYDTISTATMDSVFVQQKEGKAHKEMLPTSMKGCRESRDSAVHPLTVAIQFYLDVTGSMMDIPMMMIKNGLPHLMSKLIQGGIPDASLMFGAIGDHESDKTPLQLGQFESGDEELDMHLERTWLEKGGGANGGESYLLAWFNAINFVRTDMKDKRGQKGFVITCGDEPTLTTIPLSALKEIYGDNLTEGKAKYTAQELYDECSKDNHVFHIHVNHSGRRAGNLKEIMGQNHLEVDDYDTIPDLIVKTIFAHLNIEATELDNTITSMPVSEKEVAQETKITL